MSSPLNQPADGFAGVLFDLDGTLVDTAPDLVAALQAMQAARGMTPTPYSEGRQRASNGAIGLLTLGFPEIEVEFGDAMHLEFLERYAENICEDSVLFPGIGDLLADLESRGIPWGIVTNKPENLTLPLLDALGLASRSAATVSGDSLPVRKPAPDPLLLACDIAGIDGHRTLYVGDAGRDIEAGLAAGMQTIGVLYGYITEDDDPREWGADLLVDSPEELTQILLKAVTLED